MAAALGELGKGLVQISIGPGMFVDEFSELAVRHRHPGDLDRAGDPRPTGPARPCA